MSSLRTSPSDLLAQMALRVFEAVRDVEKARLIEEALEAPRGGALGPPAEEWWVPGADLCASAISVIGPPEGVLPTSLFRLGNWLEQMERLDRWHEPLLQHNVDLPKLPEHIAAQDRLFSKTPRLNENKALGSLIPARAFGRPFGIDGIERMAAKGEPGGILLRLLDVTAYLPPALEVADADINDPNAPTHRVPVRYFLQSSSRARRSRRALSDELRVATAPMAEAKDDLELRITEDRYSVAPVYPPERIDAIVADAVEQGAHLLLMPEMSVAGASLDRLKQAIPRARQAYAQRTNNVPALRYIFAGIAAAPEVPGGRHANFIIVLDELGKEVVRQHKLRHWNLDGRTMARFGVAERAVRTTLCATLKEDTEPGKEVVVADLDSLGRLFALICADMDSKQPGHWLLENVPVDWLYAPIMDGSTCWTQCKEADRSDAPWIIRRAARAAELGATRVMVANSMTMTSWNNEMMVREREAGIKHRFVEYCDCGIGLFLDGNCPSLMQHHVTVRFAGMSSPVLRDTKWLEDWTSFGPIPPIWRA